MSMMLCQHQRTKPRLCVVAYNRRINQATWFEHRECCTACGCEVRVVNNSLTTGDRHTKQGSI